MFPSCGNRLINDYTRIKSSALFIRSVPSLALRKSLLSTQLKALTRNKLRKKFLIDSVPACDPNHFHLSVTLMNSGKTLNLNISCKSTIEDVIKHIVYYCAYDPKLSLTLPYKSHKGYDLRIIFDNEIIYDLRPLARHSKLEDINLDTVALCVKEDYVPSKRASSFVKTAESQVSTGVTLETGVESARVPQQGANHSGDHHGAQRKAFANA